MLCKQGGVSYLYLLHINLFRKLSDVVPKCSTSGLGMFSAVDEGEEAAVKFWNEHVNEVNIGGYRRKQINLFYWQKLTEF